MSISPDLQQRLDTINEGHHLFGRTEINDLPELLLEGEVVHGLISGTHRQCNGLLVATNLRLLFLDKRIVKLLAEEFYYHSISDLHCSLSVFWGGITITSPAGKFNVRKIHKKEAVEFHDLALAFLEKHLDRSAEDEENDPHLYEEEVISKHRETQSVEQLTTDTDGLSI